MRAATVATMLVAVLTAATAPAQDADDPAPPETAANGATGATADESGNQDLVLCTPLRPLFVRLQVTIDRQGFREVWREHLAAAYDAAARATGGTIEIGDGVEGSDPVASPAVVALAGAAAGYVENDAARHRAALAAIAARNGGRLPRDEALAYLTAAQPAFSLIAGSGGAARGPALFPLLDADEDGHLTPAELAAADERLSARDFNDDEIVTERELAAEPANAGVDLDAQPSAAADDVAVARSIEGLATAGPVTALEPGARTDQLSSLLLARYDRDGDGRIRCDGSTEAEAALSAAAVAALDADGDGALEAAELAGFAAREPDLQLKVGLGGATSDRDRRARREDEATGIRVKRKIDGSFEVHLGEATIDLRRNNRDPAQNRGADELQMSAYDRDGNQYLEPAEIEGNPALSGLFVMDDADGDGKIVQDEFRRYAQRLGEASASRLIVEVFDRGQELFVLLDADRDGRLTPRELRAAAAALDEGDADGDGRLGSNEVPQQLRLDLARGTPQLARGALAVRSSRRNREGARESRAGGPRWFQKMDRNGDGDVSRREFLGPAELFPRLDADGDGLIDRREAEAAG